MTDIAAPISGQLKQWLIDYRRIGVRVDLF